MENENNKSKRNFKPFINFILLISLILFFFFLLYLIFEELFIILQLSHIAAVESAYNEIGHYTNKMIDKQAIATGKLHQLVEISRIALFILGLSTNLNIHIFFLIFLFACLPLTWFKIEKHINFLIINKN